MNGNTIIIYIMTEDFQKSIASLVEKPVYKKWNEKMGLLLAETQDFEGGNVIQLEKVFDLRGNYKSPDGPTGTKGGTKISQCKG